MNERIKETIQDCNLNFLIGSGLSRPFLPTLGNIETQLTQVAASTLTQSKKDVIRASLYRKYFDGVMAKNIGILQGEAAANSVLAHYKRFLSAINSLLLRRKSTILSKEVNIFTTNIDIFIEKAVEDLNLEFNDGFNGRFCPLFDLNNFKKSRFKRSLHYDNSAEIPVFNLLKLHGSLSWETKADRICFCTGLSHIKALQALPASANTLVIADDATTAQLDVATNGKTIDTAIQSFLSKYDELSIVNPTKEKFKHTLLNNIYYELLRLYSNEMEKENTVLFVMGFSFADEHIREITLRAANSNPTLMIYVICYQSATKAEIEGLFGRANIKNNNIHFLIPPQKDAADGGGDKFEFSFENINREIFSALFKDEDGSPIPPRPPTRPATA